MLEINKKYFLKIEAGDKILRFTAVIKNIDNEFISFEDKEGDTYNINRNKIFSYTELNSEGGQR